MRFVFLFLFRGVCSRFLSVGHIQHGSAYIVLTGIWINNRLLPVMQKTIMERMGTTFPVRHMPQRHAEMLRRLDSVEIKPKILLKTMIHLTLSIFLERDAIFFLVGEKDQCVFMKLRCLQRVILVSFAYLLSFNIFFAVLFMIFSKDLWLFISGV